MDNLLEIMRVLRKPPMGKLVVGIGDKQFAHLNDVPDPKARQRILAAIGELVSFAGGYEVLENAGLAPPSKALGSDRVRNDEELTPAQEKFLESLKATPAETEAPASQSRMRTLFDRRTERTTMAVAEEPVAPPQPRSIAEQIDVILQELIDQDSSLQGRGIRLESSNSGGLQINVDGETYQRPGQVPDKQVQELIKVALKRWESG